MLFLLVAISICLKSKSEEIKGYIINKTGDTLHGTLDIPMKGKYIRYDRITFDVKFSQNGEKAKKMDRDDIKGFGFEVNGDMEHFITWVVKKNKQVYPMNALETIDPVGEYFIRRVQEGALTKYELYLEEEQRAYRNTRPGSAAPTASDYQYAFDGFEVKKFMIVHTPEKGLIYVPYAIPRNWLKDFHAAFKMEPEFLETIDEKKTAIEDLVTRYNSWKENR